MTRRAPQSGKVLDPVWRQARAAKAGAASREAYRRRAIERASRFPDPVDAYRAGYKAGYANAYRHWRNQASKALKGRAA